jgi:hypothetical protein
LRATTEPDDGVESFQEAGWDDYAYTLTLAAIQGQASRLAVGSMNSQSGFMAGAVNIYEGGPSRWEPRAMLTAPDDFFSTSLVLESDIVLVSVS